MAVRLMMPGCVPPAVVPDPPPFSVPLLHDPACALAHLRGVREALSRARAADGFVVLQRVSEDVLSAAQESARDARRRSGVFR